MTFLLQSFVHFLQTWWAELTSAAFVLIGLPLIAGYVILDKRHLVPKQHEFGRPGSMQIIGDTLRLFMRPEVVPSAADKSAFWLAPIVSLLVAVIPLSAVCWGPPFRIAGDIDIGIFFVVGIGFVGFLGNILAGWMSSASFSGLTAIRNAVRFLSFQSLAGLAIASALLLAGSLRVQAVVDAQDAQRVWFIFLAPIGFLTTVMAAVFGTNRRLFELPENESQPAATDANEYTAFRSTLYFVGEFAGMVVVASIAITVFLGGWLRPFPNVRWLNWLDFLPGLLLAGLGARCMYGTAKPYPRTPHQFPRIAAGAYSTAALGFLLAWIYPPWHPALPGLNAVFWLGLKLVVYFHVFAWMRSTLPLLRFDQLIHLCWRILVPLSVVNIFSVAVAMLFESMVGYRWFGAAVGNGLTVAAAVFLLRLNDQRSAAVYSFTPETSDAG